MSISLSNQRFHTPMDYSTTKGRVRAS